MCPMEAERGDVIPRLSRGVLGQPRPYCRNLLFLTLVVWNNDWILHQRTHDRSDYDLRVYTE